MSPVRGWKVWPEGDDLWRDAWNVKPSDLDHTIVNAMAQAEPVNREIVRSKAAWTKVAVIGLAVEVVALTIAAAIG